MAVPKMVEEQDRLADEMLKSMQEQPKGENTDHSAPADESVSPESKEEDQSATESNETPVEESKPEPVAPQADKEYDRLKQAHAVLQGKYDAEVPRLHAEIRSLKSLIEELKTVSKSKETEKAPDKAPQAGIGSFLAKLATDYGEDLAENVKGAIEERISQAVGGLKDEVTNVKSVVNKTREERFMDDLTRIVPNWRDTYNDPGFNDFLDNVDPYSGVSYRDLAVDANTKMDAQRLARFYQSYEKTKQPVATTPAKAPEKVPDKREAMITPASTGKQNVAGVEKPDTIRASDIDAFYKAVSRGDMKFKPKEAEAFEARINKAIANGWVVEA